jgi:hypothetical protein
MARKRFRTKHRHRPPFPIQRRDLYWAISYHEAGHLVAAVARGAQVTTACAFLDEDIGDSSIIGFAGHTPLGRFGDMVASWAGQIATERWFQQNEHSLRQKGIRLSPHDRRSAAIRSAGRDRAKIRKAAAGDQVMIRRAYRCAEALLRRHWRRVERFAVLLLIAPDGIRQADVRRNWRKPLHVLGRGVL